MKSELDLSRTLASIVERIGPSIVRVESRHRLPATGVVWSSEGLLVTADHAVEREEGIEVGLADNVTVQATLVGRDPGTDVAVLRVAATGLAVPAWSKGEGLKVGNLVLAVARPGRSARASLGIVSALGGEWRAPSGGRLDRYLQTDVALQPGFSGSALVDVEGNALGMNTSGLWRGQALAVPVGTLQRVVEAVVAHGRVRRGFVGLGSFPVRLPAKLAQSAGQGSALLVMAVQPDGPADRGGILLGDLVLAVDGHPLAQIDDLLEVLNEDSVGRELAFRLVRAGQVQEVGVTAVARA
jgi:S1-C subfamily serine protease